MTLKYEIFQNINIFKNINISKILIFKNNDIRRKTGRSSVNFVNHNLTKFSEEKLSYKGVED